MTNAVSVLQRAQEKLACHRVPYPCCIIQARRNNSSAIRTKSNRAERSRVAFELEGLRAEIAQVPNLDQVIGAARRTTIVVFAREPKPGAAKTRLIPFVGTDGAAALAAAFNRDALAKASSLEPARLVIAGS